MYRVSICALVLLLFSAGAPAERNRDTRGGFEHRAGAFYGNGPEYGRDTGGFSTRRQSRYGRGDRASHFPRYHDDRHDARYPYPYRSHREEPWHSRDDSNERDAAGAYGRTEDGGRSPQRSESPTYNPRYLGRDYYRDRDANGRRNAPNAEHRYD